MRPRSCRHRPTAAFERERPVGGDTGGAVDGVGCAEDVDDDRGEGSRVSSATGEGFVVPLGTAAVSDGEAGAGGGDVQDGQFMPVPPAGAVHAEPGGGQPPGKHLRRFHHGTGTLGAACGAVPGSLAGLDFIEPVQQSLQGVARDDVARGPVVFLGGETRPVLGVNGPLGVIVDEALVPDDLIKRQTHDRFPCPTRSDPLGRARYGSAPGTAIQSLRQTLRTHQTVQTVQTVCAGHGRFAIMTECQRGDRSYPASG